MQIDKELQFYLSIVQEHYVFEDDPIFVKAQASSKMQQVLNRKSDFNNDWLSCLDKIRTKPKRRIRDYGNSHNEPCYRCQLTLNENEAIHIFISFLCPVFGYYYCNYNEVSNSEFAVLIKDSSRPVNCISYSPYSLEQIEEREKITEIILEYFPGYQIFPMEYSKTVLRNVELEGLIYPRIELFQLLFSLYMDMLL
jgi:hypothetical protein